MKACLFKKTHKPFFNIKTLFFIHNSTSTPNMLHGLKLFEIQTPFYSRELRTVCWSLVLWGYPLTKRVRPSRKLEARLMAVLFLALFLGSIKPSDTTYFIWRNYPLNTEQTPFAMATPSWLVVESINQSRYRGKEHMFSDRDQLSWRRASGKVAQAYILVTRMSNNSWDM